MKNDYFEGFMTGVSVTFILFIVIGLLGVIAQKEKECGEYKIDEVPARCIEYVNELGNKLK